MSSLRNEVTFAPLSAHTTQASRPHSTSPPPSKKQKMTLTQTYRLAHRARGKLSVEASRGDHDLRLLVGHANLLDGLMVELQTAEREQDAWFEQSISKPEQPKVTFAPSVEQHQLEIPDSSDDEEEEDSDDEEPRKTQLTMPAQTTRRQRTRSPPAPVSHYSYDDEDEEMADDDDESDNLELALTRTRSHSPEELSAVPELVHESDSSDSEESEDEEESIKPTPAVIVKDFATNTQSQRQQKRQEAEWMDFMEEDNDYLPPQPLTPMVAVY